MDRLRPDPGVWATGNHAEIHRPEVLTMSHSRSTNRRRLIRPLAVVPASLAALVAGAGPAFARLDPLPMPPAGASRTVAPTAPVLDGLDATQAVLISLLVSVAVLLTAAAVRYATSRWLRGRVVTLPHPNRQAHSVPQPSAALTER